ncbi:riboflavin biosynthesis protein RibD [Desulfovibrio sp. X2]|nr:riboflavin biosynthesis protein RibD [Desulfovibrio sp. X2]
MAEAVRLARQGLGATAPNPCVGAVLVQDGEIVARGWHTAHGKPHAEREAIADARARGVDTAACDLYVTLEPCNHHGKTPPCTEAVLEAGIRRVFVGAADPNPRVAGGGGEFLRSRGVTVDMGVLGQECRDLIADFLAWQLEHRAYCILKLAETLDGRIAARGSRAEPEAVSGPESHARVQALRALAGAVIVGGGTLRADNPRLTCRQPDRRPDAPQPLAVVVTRRLPWPDEERHWLLMHRHRELIFWTSEEAARSDAAKALAASQVRVWGLPEGPRGLALRSGLERLFSECGVHYALCEGGGRLAYSLAGQGLADETRLFLSPRVLGDACAVPAFCGGFAPEGAGDAGDAPCMAGALRLRFCGAEPSGEDMMLTLRPQTFAAHDLAHKEAL